MWDKQADFWILELKNTKGILGESVITIMFYLIMERNMLIMTVIRIMLRFRTRIVIRELIEMLYMVCPKSNVCDFIVKQLCVRAHSDRLGSVKEELSSQASGHSIVFDHPESKDRHFREIRFGLPYKPQYIRQRASSHRLPRDPLPGRFKGANDSVALPDFF